MDADVLDGRTYDSSDSETSTVPEWSPDRTAQRKQNKISSTVQSRQSLPTSTILLCSLLCLLVILLFSSVYLVLRLGHIQDRMEGPLPQNIANSRTDSWRNILSSRYSKFIDANPHFVIPGPIKRFRSILIIILIRYLR